VRASDAIQIGILHVNLFQIGKQSSGRQRPFEWWGKSLCQEWIMSILVTSQNKAAYSASKAALNGTVISTSICTLAQTRGLEVL